jgi:hypothetical protein
VRDWFDIDDGTLARVPMSQPGIVGIDAAAPKAAKPPPERLRVLIVEHGANQLKDVDRKAARKVVEADLKTVTAKSREHFVRAGFEITWPALMPAGKPDWNEFLVLLIAEPDIPKMRETTLQLMRDHGGFSERDIKDIQQQLGGEEGFFPWFDGVTVMETKVIVIYLRYFEPALANPDNQVDFRRYFGNIIVHEMGHAMGEPEHPGGVFKSLKNSHYPDPEKLRKNLGAFVKTHLPKAEESKHR